MKVRISPSKANGEVKAPASKSMAHRYLIGSFFTGSDCVVDGIEESEDMKATLSCLKALGATCDYNLEDKSVVVNGSFSNEYVSTNKDILLNCNESGSTLRFMIPICLTYGKRITLTGSEKLFSRPLSVYEDICEKQELTFEKNGNVLVVEGKLRSGEYVVQGNISSQFITGLLFALSRLESNSKITLIPPVESRSYIDMTLQVLHDFGVNADWIDDLTLFIRGNQTYNPGEYQVEGDYSNAAFLDVFNCIEGEVRTKGLRKDSLQGDKVYQQHFDSIEFGVPTIDITDCPDLGPVLFALAAIKNGATFTGTRRLKIKESDRAQAMYQELLKCGVHIEVGEDTVVINKEELKAPSEIISSHNDHRIVMAMATVLSVVGGEIEGAEAVNKSFPDYFKLISSLGIDCQIM